MTYFKNEMKWKPAAGNRICFLPSQMTLFVSALPSSWHALEELLLLVKNNSSTYATDSLPSWKPVLSTIPYFFIDSTSLSLALKYGPDSLILEKAFLDPASISWTNSFSLTSPCIAKLPQRKSALNAPSSYFPIALWAIRSGSNKTALLRSPVILLVNPMNTLQLCEFFSVFPNYFFLILVTEAEFTSVTHKQRTPTYTITLQFCLYLFALHVPLKLSHCQFIKLVLLSHTAQPWHVLFLLSGNLFCSLFIWYK